MITERIEVIKKKLPHLTFGVDYFFDGLKIVFKDEENNKLLQDIEDGVIQNKTKKEFLEKLNDMTIGELIENEETFGDIGIRGYELGKVLVKIFYGGNDYGEMKDHRIFLEEMFLAQPKEIRNKMLENPKIVEILGKSEKTKLILEKFKN